MMTTVTKAQQFAKSNVGLAGVSAVVTALATAFVGFWLFAGSRSPAAMEKNLRPQSGPEANVEMLQTSGLGQAAAGVEVCIGEEKRDAIGLRVAPVRRAEWPQHLKVTGRLELNENRVSHISPLVEGVVREVCVELGQQVTKGEALTYIDSREVGEAKLKLVENQLSFEFAKKSHQRNQTIHDNTRALLAALESGQSTQDIGKQFRDRPIGQYREKLVSALARRNHSAADHERLTALGAKSVIPEKELIRTRAEYESASASFQALIEQIRFDSYRQILQSEQALREAETALAIGRSQLMILGYGADEVDKMDPIGEGERVALYTVRAPFDGTIIGKHAVLSEHVDQHADLFELADVSTVWLRADVFEKDLGALHGLEGKKVTFRTTSHPNQDFSAEVFSLGSVVDDKTRAVRLLATVENRQKLLRPGMFVEIDLCVNEMSGVIQVPASAVQRHEDLTFVFVRQDDAAFQRRDVVVGRSTAEMIEILSGLVEDESVVVEGGFALKSEMLSELMVEE